MVIARVSRVNVSSARMTVIMIQASASLPAEEIVGYHSRPKLQQHEFLNVFVVRRLELGGCLYLGVPIFRSGKFNLLASHRVLSWE